MSKSMEIEITVNGKTVKTNLANLKKFSRMLHRANRARKQRSEAER